MSFLASEWARFARTNYPAEKTLLTELAARADHDGSSAYPSVPTLADILNCSTRSVQRYLRGLVDLGLIAPGNQDAAAALPERYRPVVYDLLIPFHWYSAAQIDKVNADRQSKGLPPLSPESRPPTPPRKRTRAKPALKPDTVKPAEPRQFVTPADQEKQDQPSGVTDSSGVTICRDQGRQIDTQIGPIPTGTKSSKRSPASAGAANDDRRGDSNGSNVTVAAFDGGMFPEPAREQRPGKPGKPAGEVNAGVIVGEYIDRCPKPPPSRVIGNLARQIKLLLDEGIDADDVRRGVAAWMNRRLTPGMLPDIVNEVMNHQAAASLRVVGGAQLVNGRLPDGRLMDSRAPGRDYHEPW